MPMNVKKMSEIGMNVHDFECGCDGNFCEKSGMAGDFNERNGLVDIVVVKRVLL